MAKFLVDESLPRAVTRALLAAGHDVVDARDVGLRGGADEVVHARAAAEGRIVLAGDLDFANALRFPPGTHPGVLVLRAPDEWDSDRRACRVLEAFAEVDVDRNAGAIIIVDPSRSRVFGPGTGTPTSS